MKRYRVKPILIGMKIGDSIKFPIEHLTSVRVAASENGLALQRKYTTRTNRREGVIEVSRIQ